MLLGLCLMYFMFFLTSLMFYTINLVLLVSIFLFVMNSCGVIHGLTSIMVAVIYIGAMMILIGYICAICPNILILQPNYKTLLSSVSVFFMVNFLVLVDANLFIQKDYSEGLSSFFYSVDGCSVLLFLVALLFLSLLMITSQYLSPKGPFRSVG